MYQGSISVIALAQLICTSHLFIPMQHYQYINPFKCDGRNLHEKRKKETKKETKEEIERKKKNPLKA